MAGCPTFAYCPSSDGSVKSCQTNCDCVYCGNTSMITACKGQCTASGGAVSVGINTQPIQDATSGLLQGLISPLITSLPIILERVGLFLFSMVLVVAGFMALKS